MLQNNQPLKKMVCFLVCEYHFSHQHTLNIFRQHTSFFKFLQTSPDLLSITLGAITYNIVILARISHHSVSNKTGISLSLSLHLCSCFVDICIICTVLYNAISTSLAFFIFSLSFFYIPFVSKASLSTENSCTCTDIFSLSSLICVQLQLTRNGVSMIKCKILF